MLVTVIRSLARLLVARRETMMFFAALACAAWLYAGVRQARADRDATVRRAELICAHAGSDFRAGRTRGDACAARVAALARAERDLAQQSARLIAAQMDADKARMERDREAARASAATASAATQKMEAENGRIDANDNVGPDWFAALDAVAGLQPPR